MPVDKTRKEEWEAKPQAQTQTTRERFQRRGAIALDLSADDPLSVSDTKTEGTVDTDAEKDLEAADCKKNYIENVHASAKEKNTQATKLAASQRPKSFTLKQSMNTYEIKDIEKAPLRVAHSNNPGFSPRRNGQSGRARSSVIVSRDFDESMRSERALHASSTRDGRQTAIFDKGDNNHELAPFIPPHVRMKRFQENNAAPEQKGIGHTVTLRSSDSVATDDTNPQGANSKKSLEEVKPSNLLSDNTPQNKPTHATNVERRDILSRSKKKSKSKRSADTFHHRDSIQRATSAPRSRNPSIRRTDHSVQETIHNRPLSETTVQNDATVNANDGGSGGLGRSITSPNSMTSTEINHHKDRTQRSKSAPRSRNSAISQIGQIDPSRSFDIISTPSISTSKGEDKHISRRQTIGRCENVENQRRLPTDCDAGQRRHQVRSRHRSLDEEINSYSQQRTQINVHTIGPRASPQKERHVHDQEPSKRADSEDKTAAEDVSTISGPSRKSSEQYHRVLAADDVSTQYSNKHYNDDRSYKPHQNRTAADEASFSTRSFSTRHTSRSYPGRRRHTNDSGRHRQFLPKQAMYRSKSASRSLPNSTGFVEDEKIHNPLENLDFIDCYSIPIVDDDPSLITDTASYDFRSRRKNGPHAPSVHLSFDASSVQSKMRYDDDLTEAMSRRSNRTHGTNARSSVTSNMLYDDDLTDVMSRQSTRTYGASAQSVKSRMVYDVDLTDAMSRRSTRTYRTSAHSTVKSKSVYDDDSTDANGDFDELTEFESVQDVPNRNDVPNIRLPKKGMKRKQCLGVFTIAVLALAAIGMVVVFVALPSVNKGRVNALQAPEVSGTDNNGNAKLMNNSISPSTQPSFGALTEVTQLGPPPKDLEGRCSPSNFPHGVRVCEEFCRAAECCYPSVKKSDGTHGRCFDVSASTPIGSANRVQCKAYLPYCDVFYDPWVGSMDGIIRPPPNNLDKVCTHRRRRHNGLDVGTDQAVDSRYLSSDDFECLKACLPSKCCSGIKVADLIPNDLVLSSHGTYTNNNGDYVITSCTEKNEASCQAYEKICEGVFARHDAVGQIGESSLSQSTDSSGVRATFSPTHATMPVASTPSPWFSHSDFTPAPFLSELSDVAQTTISSLTDSSPDKPPSGSQIYRPTAGNYHPASSPPTFLSSLSSYPDNRPTAVAPSITNAHTSLPSSSLVPAMESTTSGDAFPPPAEISSTASHSTGSSPSTPTLENNPSGGNSPFSYSPSFTQTQNHSISISDNVTSASVATVSNSVTSKLTSIPSAATNTYYDSQATAAPESASSSAQTSPSISKAPAAAIEQIEAACSGEENIEKIKNGDIQECLDACRAGMCCYIEQFDAAGISSKNEIGLPAHFESCIKGNEVICFDYASCLVMTLESDAIQTHSPSPAMVVPRPVSIDVVPFANSGKIFEACSGPDNIKLITNQDVTASTKCLEACSDGFCCYIQMFSERGITAFDQEGNALVIDSCWEGNEEVCTGYEGCLVLTLAPPRPTPVSPALNSSLTTTSFSVTPPSTSPPTTSSPITTAPTTARPQTPSPTTILTPRPTESVGSFSGVDSATNPTGSIAAAPLEAITEACTGTEKVNLLSRGHEKTQAECLSACSQGACCFADIFNAIGISVIDETGNRADISSCLKGNEIACRDYSGCLNLSLSYSRPITSSPTTTTPAPSVLIRFVAEAPLKEITGACTGEENTSLITNGDEKAITECFNACRLGVCCYASVFNAIGMNAIDEQGKKVPIDSCFAGNEVICRDYSGCLILTLAV